MSPAPAQDPRLAGTDRPEAGEWQFRIYIGNHQGMDSPVYRNLIAICEECLRGHYEVEVCRLSEHPEAVEQDRIFALPTVVRRRPEPVRKVIGDLSDRAKAIAGLDIPAHNGPRE